MVNQRWVGLQGSNPRPPYRHVFQWHKLKRKNSPEQGRRAFHARCSMITRFSDCHINCFRRSTRELFCQGLTIDLNSSLKHCDLFPRQENLFLIVPACFPPLLRHMIFMLGLRMHAVTMERDPRFALKLTTAVGTWQETCTTGHPLSRSSITRSAHCGISSMSCMLSHSNALNSYGLLAPRSLKHL